MKNLSLISKIAGFIFPFLKGKAAKTIGSEISEAFNNEGLALWEKIKPIFIKEDKDFVTDLEKQPDDRDIQGMFNYKLKKLLESNNALKANLEAIIKKADDNGDKIKVQGSKNINFGDISNNTGPVRIGDNVQK